MADPLKLKELKICPFGERQLQNVGFQSDAGSTAVADCQVLTKSCPN